MVFSFFFQAEDGIRDYKVTGVQTCALPISRSPNDRGERLTGLSGGGCPVGKTRRIQSFNRPAAPPRVIRLPGALTGGTRKKFQPSDNGAPGISSPTGAVGSAIPGRRKAENCQAPATCGAT